MFGLSFGEFVVIGIVALVVVGPRNLPTLLRTVAENLARLRRMAADIRAESGIDEALELDGLRAEIHRLRSMTNVETLLEPGPARPPRRLFKQPPREQEYPRMGPDSYGAVSEDEAPYVEGLEADAPDAEGSASEVAVDAAAHGPTTVPALSPMAMRAAMSAPTNEKSEQPAGE